MITDVSSCFTRRASISSILQRTSLRAANSTRFQISIPAYAGYTYEVYGNPTLLDAGNVTNMTLPYRNNMSWAALPFPLSQTGVANTNKFTATSDGMLKVFLKQKADKGFYYVSFRVPGANTGTP